MISTLKVTDGDLLIVNLESDEDISYKHIESVRDRIQTWLDKRGLQNVEVIIGGGRVKTQITKLTVNDVFEEQILKGENSG